MRGLYTFLLLIFFATVSLAGTLTYTPDDHSYSITFPVTWSVVEKSNDEVIVIAPEKKNDTFRERVIISKEYVGNNTNVEHYLYNAIKEVKKKYPSFIKTGEKNTLISNLYAKEITYTVEINGIRINADLILLFTRGMAVKYFFLSDENDKSEFKNIFETIKKNIKII